MFQGNQKTFDLYLTDHQGALARTQYKRTENIISGSTCHSIFQPKIFHSSTDNNGDLSTKIHLLNFVSRKLYQFISAIVFYSSKIQRFSCSASDAILLSMKCQYHCFILLCFRWASFLGKLLTELTVDGKTTHDITDFRFDRPAVIDPNFTPHFYYGIGQSSKL